MDPQRDETVSNGLPRGEKGWLGSGTWILNEAPGDEVSGTNWKVYLGASHAVLAWGNLIAMVESPHSPALRPRGYGLTKLKGAEMQNQRTIRSRPRARAGRSSTLDVGRPGGRGKIWRAGNFNLKQL